MYYFCSKFGLVLTLRNASATARVTMTVMAIMMKPTTRTQCPTLLCKGSKGSFMCQTAETQCDTTQLLLTKLWTTGMGKP